MLGRGRIGTPLFWLRYSEECVHYNNPKNSGTTLISMYSQEKYNFENRMSKLLFSLARELLELI